MADTFTWRPTSQSTGSRKASVKRARFGDGYAQSARDGLNSVSRSYQLNFVGKKAEISEIVAFLDAHVGLSFGWACPWGPALWQCDEYSDSHLGGAIYGLTATFEQTFQP